MAYYGKYRRASRPQVRVITVKYAGKCVCCGAEIKAGESAEYFPVGTIGSTNTPQIGHVGGLDGTGARCTAEIRKRDYPEYHAETVAREAARRAVNDYAGDGLDARYEDQCADICGR